MEEATGLPYASKIPGRMHVMVMRPCCLAPHAISPRHGCSRGAAVLIFQPTEEAGGGGRVIVREGVLDRFDVQEVYALHTTPGIGAGVHHSEYDFNDRAATFGASYFARLIERALPLSSRNQDDPSSQLGVDNAE